MYMYTTKTGEDDDKVNNLAQRALQDELGIKKRSLKYSENVSYNALLSLSLLSYTHPHPLTCKQIVSAGVPRHVPGLTCKLARVLPQP